MTDILYLGHAGFLVAHNGRSVLLDPWFHSAFADAWFPYPDNQFLLPQVAGKRFDFLYISHTHEDHFDAKVLQTLDRAVTVLCPQYRSRRLQRQLERLGFKNLVLLGHKQTAELYAGARATMFLDVSHKEDSALLLELDGFRFLNLNDCNTRLDDLPREVDLLSAQFSGAMWYPNCYDYAPQEMQRKTDKVRNDLMASLFRKCHQVHAKTYIPSAGPVCFLDPALQEFNDRETTIFPHWEDVAADFHSACPQVNVLRMQPGDRAIVENGAPSLQQFGGVRPDSSIDAYSARRESQWNSYYAGPEPTIHREEVPAYFTALQKRNRLLSAAISKHVQIATQDHAWIIELGNSGMDAGEPAAAHSPPAYTLHVPARVLRQILDGQTGWEEALLSMRIRLHRDPDVFDSRFMGLLRYGNEPAQTIEMMKEARSHEWIERDGYRLQRYCPHAGEDLTGATVCDGVLECPRHHWKWNMETGECVDGGAIALRIERVAAKRDHKSRLESESEPSLTAESKSPLE
jgi:UDP-MurNAc hydroxylase